MSLVMGCSVPGVSVPSVVKVGMGVFLASAARTSFQYRPVWYRAMPLELRAARKAA
jgi:hypothetical protein